jgi:hypothetical protein
VSIPEYRIYGAVRRKRHLVWYFLDDASDGAGVCVGLVATMMSSLLGRSPQQSLRDVIFLFGSFFGGMNPTAAVKNRYAILLTGSLSNWRGQAVGQWYSSIFQCNESLVSQ